MSAGHAILAPSAASRWARCPGSVAACKNVPDTTSPEAASGTLTHELAQRCLTNDTDPQSYVGSEFTIEGHSFTVDQERVDRLGAYLDAVRRRSGKLFVEVKLDTSRILGVPGQGGTGDAVIADVERATIEVRDLKDGYLIVQAPGNEQLLIYGAAALDTLDMVSDWKALLVAIHQPRRDHYSEYIYTREEVEQEMARIRVAAQKAMALYTSGTPEEIEAALVPGPIQCSFCPIRGSCKKRAAAILDSFPVELEGTEHLLMSEAELADALMRVDDIAGWCRDIQKEAMKRTVNGLAIPGFKTVQGRKGPRQWVDEKKAEGSLSLLLEESQMYRPREIISPTTAGKLLKGGYEAIAELVTQSEGSLSLVPMTDERPLVELKIAEFGLETGNTDLV